MELISSVVYNANNHSTIDFVKKYFARMAVDMMRYEVVDAMITRRSIRDSITSILETKWNYTKMVGSMVASQAHVVELIDDAWIHVYLLENAPKDKLVLFVSGQHKEVLNIDIGFIGNPETLKRYLKELTITEFEAYADIHHYIED